MAAGWRPSRTTAGRRRVKYHGEGRIFLAVCERNGREGLQERNRTRKTRGARSRLGLGGRAAVMVRGQPFDLSLVSRALKAKAWAAWQAQRGSHWPQRARLQLQLLHPQVTTLGQSTYPAAAPIPYITTYRHTSRLYNIFASTDILI